MPSLWVCIRKAEDVRTDLRESGLVGAVQGPGLHMLWDKALPPQHMQADSLLRWSQMWMDGFIGLYKQSNTHLCFHCLFTVL